MPKEEMSLPQLAAAVAKSGARWEPRETAFSAMSEAEQKLLLGYTPGPEDPSLEESEKAAKAGFKAFAALAMEGLGYPSTYDLRAQGMITSIKNQGGCGSCVAFGTVAAVEGTLRRQRSDPNLAVDYSEAQLFYCHARAEGRRCSNGWWSSNALNAFRDKGVVDEACYPYTPGDQDCTGLCGDAASRATKISAWHRLTDVSQMKEWIASKGPLVACYTVYQDFFNYSGGIYRHVSGSVAGGHCVSCVGYSDVEQYWICKNSWGPGFGEKGFFRIAYGECGIDSFMDAVDSVVDNRWERGQHIDGLWAINQNRNAWVHVQGKGWYRISAESDVVFLTMLAQLAAAKTGNRPVDIHLNQQTITQIYVF